MTDSASWSFREDDAKRLLSLLESLIEESSARTAMIVDRTGQMLVVAGETPMFDLVSFASLSAADFSANDQLAKMLGESEFGALFHQGEKDSLFLADVAKRVILVVLFDNRTTLGLVKLRVRSLLPHLGALFAELFQRRAMGGPKIESAFLGEAEDEIDKLFGA